MGKPILRAYNADTDRASVPGYLAEIQGGPEMARRGGLNGA